MPELPDITVYIRALEERVLHKTLLGMRISSPFVVRTASPPISAAAGKTVTGLRRLGKQILFELDGNSSANGLIIIIHLMIAGRLHWRQAGAKLPGKMALAAFDFEEGALMFTEAATKKRASIHVVPDDQSLAGFDRGGIDVLAATPDAFAATLRSENHTIKRALTDPRMLSGIGNAYSDEILFRARVSPFKQTRQFSDDEFADLLLAVRSVMKEWIDRLDTERKGGFPEKVTAFRPEMAVHGKFGKPCPICGSAVQRISYADNEANYCATCQTGGKLLADRGLSRLLKSDWPKTLAELETLRESRRGD